MTDAGLTRRIAVLGDTTRRGIFEILSSGPCSVAEIACQLPVTRPAVSQHLRVLKEAGLVTHQTVGTRHVYQLDPDGIASLREYLDTLWQRALNDFKAMAERSFAEKKKKR
jgi:DNA-binding transcriptional ArsR family regulator